jgi:hypothetical protein
MQALFMLQGSDTTGTVFDFNVARDLYTARPGIHCNSLSPAVLHSALQHLARLGTALRHIRNFTDALLRADPSAESASSAAAGGGGGKDKAKGGVMSALSSAFDSIAPRQHVFKSVLQLRQQAMWRSLKKLPTVAAFTFAMQTELQVSLAGTCAPVATRKSRLSPPPSPSPHTHPAPRAEHVQASDRPRADRQGQNCHPPAAPARHC